ncbi:unnamed protein product [Rotaria sordida]|uniref:Transmembrane protein n=1 Tax=Rotaria sordida TaxID=392033 RepID=A0A814ZE49_9BILA|nr:unnamed protein product [Rotaria sordida]
MLIIAYQFSLLIFLLIFSLIQCLHFLGRSFTYKHVQQIIDYKIYKSILVEIHFPISNNFFLCTSKQINDHMIAYLIDENILYDNTTKKYLWNQTLIKKRDQQYYDIECFSDKFHNACQNFKQQI